MDEKIKNNEEQNTEILEESKDEEVQSNSDKEEVNTEDQEQNDFNEANLETLKKELDETKDKLLRSLAENENIRKQIEKIRLETNRYGVQPLAREILNVVDNFERAMSSKNQNSEASLEEGLTLIQKEILSILEKFNIKKIEALGQEFNANYHQAMFEKETEDYNEGHVCEIVQDGYTFHERLLRPTLVGVSKKEERIEKADENQESVKIDEKD